MKSLYPASSLNANLITLYIDNIRILRHERIRVKYNIYDLIQIYSAITA